MSSYSTSADSRASDRARMADIEAQILNLRHALRELRAERDLIKGRLDTYRYPALTLPNELISEIFIHFLPIYPSSSRLAGILSPTMLLGICRKWREIALATPVLWRAMLLECTCDTGEEIEMVKTWLSRSGSYLLSIQTHKYSYTEAETLEAILPHRARWEHVNFHLLLSQVPAIEGPLPFLRTLEIRISSDDVPLSPIAFHDAPRLTAATLWDFEYPAAFLPWSQLTSLTLIAKFPEECTPVLVNATSLVYCELVLCGDHIPESDIVLSRLESLVVIHFGNEDWGRAAGYLLCFTAPALRRLQVPDTFLVPDPISSLTTFISQSGCTLQEVCITGERSISKKAYREAFPSIPTVSFNRMLTDWYCREADEIRRRGTQSMADFEDSES